VAENKKYYESLDFLSLSDLITQTSDTTAQSILETFSCKINSDLETFLTSGNAVRFEINHTTRTYLYIEMIEEKPEIIAYFTISLKILSTEGLAKSLIKKLDGIDRKRTNIPCFLIAQLGKTSSCEYRIGQHLLDDAIDTIQSIKKQIGGRFIILDSVNVEKVLDFYKNKPNIFTLLDTPKKTSKSLKMYYPLYSN